MQVGVGTTFTGECARWSEPVARESGPKDRRTKRTAQPASCRAFTLTSPRTVKSFRASAFGKACRLLTCDFGQIGPCPPTAIAGGSGWTSVVPGRHAQKTGWVEDDHVRRLRQGQQSAVTQIREGAAHGLNLHAKVIGKIFPQHGYTKEYSRAVASTNSCHEAGEKTCEALG